MRVVRFAWALVATASLSAAVLAARDIGTLEGALSVVAFGSVWATWRVYHKR